jgi:hypothetical protein
MGPGERELELCRGPSRQAAIVWLERRVEAVLKVDAKWTITIGLHMEGLSKGHHVGLDFYDLLTAALIGL